MTAHRWHLCAVWQVMTHDWVTDEGSQPLQHTLHRKVQLKNLTLQHPAVRSILSGDLLVNLERHALS